MKPLARGAVKLVPGLRKVARKQAGRLQSKNQFSAGVLRRSLEKSLRELRTDYVDILLMHAAPLSVLAQEDLLLELERVVAEGKVRVAGISGEAEVIAAALASGAGVLRSAQFACDIGNFGFLESVAGIADPGRAEPRMFLVGNHPFGGATGIGETLRGIAALADDPALPDELRAKLDLKDPQLLPEVILNAVLAGTGIDAVVPAMMQRRHLQSNCRALEDCRFSHAELVELRRELASVAEGLRETA